MNDNYSHCDENLIYVVENIPGPSEDSAEYTELMNHLNSQLLDHCSCEQSCDSNCICVMRCGGIINLNNVIQTKAYLECNSLCKCFANCRNRIVQRGPIDGLIISICKQKRKGLGLYTTNSIPNGTFICEYAGEIITKSEAIKRSNWNKLNGKMNYIYCLNEHSGGRVFQTFIDPSMFGNIGRYINHSCEPNCQLIPVRIDTPTPKLAIFSCKDIPAGNELMFDYGGNSNSTQETMEFDNVLDKKECLCKSGVCRGFMPFDAF